MKKISLFISIIFTLALLATYAVAGTGSAPAVGGANVPLTVPKVSKSVCTTIGASRAGTTTLDISATRMFSWKAFSATDGSAVTVKRSFNSNTAYMPSTGEKDMPAEAAATSAVFTRYSGGATVTVCSDRN